MKSFDYYKYKQLDAVDAILNNRIDYFQRKVCRWFSKEFNTPLEAVYTLPWDFVIQNYYEGLIEQMRASEVYDIAVTEFCPDLMEEEDRLAQEFADSLLEKQTKQLKKKGIKNQSLDKSSPKDENTSKINSISKNYEDL